MAISQWRKRLQGYNSPFPLLSMLTLGALVWCIWNESFALNVIVQGYGFFALSLALTNRYLLKAQYQRVFRISPLMVLRYLGVLVIAIFESGLHAIHVTLTHRIDPRVLDLPTRITNPFHGVLVANAITLTPGTVTIDHGRGRFMVIWISCPTDRLETASEMIKGHFERVLAPPAGKMGS